MDVELALKCFQLWEHIKEKSPKKYKELQKKKPSIKYSYNEMYNFLTREVANLDPT